MVGLQKAPTVLLGKSAMENLHGASILIGIDCILNGPSSFPPSLILYLQNKGIFSWDKLIISWSNSSPVWKSASDLHVRPPLSPIWTSFVQGLSSMPIHRAAPLDALVWYPPPSPSPSRSKTYMLLSLPPYPPHDLSDDPLESLLPSQNGPFSMACLLQQKSHLGSASAEGMVGSWALLLVPHGLWNESSSVFQLPFLLVHMVWSLHLLWFSSSLFFFCSGSNQVVEWSVRHAAIPLYSLLLAYLEVEELFHLPRCQ